MSKLDKNSVLTVFEHREGKIRDISYQLVNAGRKLADSIDGDLIGIIMGKDADTLAEEIRVEGLNEIIFVDNQEQDFDQGFYKHVIMDFIESYQPNTILVPHTAWGLAYGPVLATDKGLPFSQAVEEIKVDRDHITAKYRQFESKARTERRFPLEGSKVFTVEEGIWTPATEPSDDNTLTQYEPSSESIQIEFKREEYLKPVIEEDISSADVIVSSGRGIEEEENLEMIRELADLLGGSLACSRPLVDHGWLPDFRQVGDSGQTVKPNIYIAIGISGGMHHVKGMQSSDTIIAINNDPSAPIFNVADYGIIADLFDVVPMLIEFLKG